MEHGADRRAANPDLIEVSDLDLAAYLICCGASLVGVVPTTDPQRRQFVLNVPDSTAVGGLRLFMAGEARVEPRQFAQARRVLQRALRAST